MSQRSISGSTRSRKEHKRLIKRIQSKYWRTTHKFGIEILRSVEEAYEIDTGTGPSHWARAIEKEMRNVRVAFEKLDGMTEDKMRTGKVKPGFTYCSTHMIL